MDNKEKEFRKFLDLEKAWIQTTHEVHLKFEKLFNRSTRTMTRWRKNLKEGKQMHYIDFIAKSKRTIKLDECLFCKIKKDLQVHHIDKNIKNNKVNNLVVLCIGCHRRLHGLLERMKNRRQNDI